MPVRRSVDAVSFDRETIAAAREELRGEIFKLFRDPLPKEAAQYVSRQVARSAKRRGDLPPDVAEQLLHDMDLSSWQPLVPKAEKSLTTVSRETSQLAMWRVGIPEEDSLSITAQQFASEWAHHRAAELVGMKHAPNGKLAPNPNAEMAISETTRSMLRATVEQAIREEWSADKLTAEIMEANVFSAARAEKIARTEINMAANRGQFIAFKTSGSVSGTRWLTVKDNRVDPHCRDNERAGVVPIDAPFPSGHKYPPAHSNCRCKMAAVVELGKDKTE